MAGAAIERIVAPFSFHDIPARSARERIGFSGALHRKYEILSADVFEIRMLQPDAAPAIFAQVDEHV